MKDPNDDRFNSLEEFRDSIELGLDIQIDLYGIRYYIGAPLGTLILSWNDGDNEVKFNSVDELFDYKINGKPLKEIYKDIEIYCM